MVNIIFNEHSSGYMINIYLLPQFEFIIWITNIFANHDKEVIVLLDTLWDQRHKDSLIEMENHVEQSDLICRRALRI